MLHGRCGRQQQIASLKLKLDETQIGQGNDAGQNVAPYLAVRPVPDGKYADQVVVLRLPKRFLDHVAVQTGTDDFFRRPCVLIGDEDILSKFLQVSANPVVIFSVEELPLVFVLLKGDVVEVLGKMEFFAGFIVVTFNTSFFRPMLLLRVIVSST